MGKPTKEQMDEALLTAQHMREAGEDQHYIAKALLNLNYRMGYMEKVLEAAEHFMRGQDVHAHTVLKQAIEKARLENRHTGGMDDQEKIGL